MEFEYPVAEWFTGEYAVIPAHMQETIRRYVIDRQPSYPGGITGNPPQLHYVDFLTAVICNDLRNAVGHADADNLPLIPLYVRWFYNRAPAGCHGSIAAFEAWVVVR